MPKATKPGYYAVRTGRVPGIYLSWADCEAQIKGFTGATYKKLNTEAEAIEFISAKHSATRPPASAVHKPSGITDPAVEDENNCDVVYCDGACRGNGQAGSVAGVGVWWGHGDPRNIAERCPGDQTNNRAELIAIVRILETTPRLTRPLLIKTDSNYSIQCVTLWISKWMSNGFVTADGKPVKNRELIKYLAALLHARRRSSQTVKFKHVRGHVGIEGNEAADRLANMGAAQPAVPERDWEKLEAEVLRNLEVSDRDLKLQNTLPLVSQKSSSPRPNVTATQGLPRSRNDIFRGSSGPSEIPTLGPQFGPVKNSTPVMSKEELEMYASCLLDSDELSTLGKDGVFDSDF